MGGYGSHTFMWVNDEGERFWVKYHFKSDQGWQTFTNAEAAQLAGADADFHRRDLFEAIARGEFPTWTLQLQIMPYADAKTYWSSVDPDVGKRIEEKVRAGAATEPVPGMGES
jgi:catalase